MTNNYYQTFFANEITSLDILVKKARLNNAKSKGLICAAQTQLAYIKQLSCSLFKAQVLNDIFVDVEPFLNCSVEEVDLETLAQSIERFKKKFLSNSFGFPSSIIASWAHIYSSDNHAITSRANKAGVILSVNYKFSEVSGYRIDELVGEDHSILNSGIHPKGFFKEMWQHILSGVTWKGTVCNQRKNGQKYWVESSISPVFNDDGEIVYYISIRTDITEVKQMEADARRTERRLRLSQQFANIGTWEWQIQTGELWWSERIAPMFGGEQSEMETSYENFITAVHSDDRRKVETAIQQCIESSGVYEVSHRVVWPNGEVRWLLEKGNVVRDKSGLPLSMLGAVQDITQKKQFEDLMLKQQKLLDIVHATTLFYLKTQDFEKFCEGMLEGVLSLSGAQMGVVGEVIFSEEDNKGCLRSHAVSSFSLESEKFFISSVALPCGTGIGSLDSVINQVLISRDLVILNSSEKDLVLTEGRQGEVPLRNYMGIPVVIGQALLGVLILANHQEDFNKELYEFLTPFLATYGVMILSKRLQERDEERMIELQSAISKAEEANRAKSSFLSSMSHELRTPLNSILGFSELIGLSGLDVSQRDQLSEIKKSGEHLLNLINDILDLAKIDVGHLALSIEKVEICGLLRECVAMLERLAVANDVSVKLFCEPHQEIYMLADYTRVKQVVLNFLSNAIKYNRQGGGVELKLEQLVYASGEFVRLSVVDNGLGIAEKFQGKVFEPFNRLGRESKAIEGTGIGLSICQNLVHAMEGHIGFESEEGVGSLFWVELPGSSRIVKTNEEPENITQADSGQPKSLTTGEMKNKQVLYIEDNVANMKLMSGIVQKVPGIVLTITVNAEEGIEKARLLSPDLILLDINLPGMSGKDALPLLKQLSNLKEKQTAIYALSANAMVDEVQEGLEMGFDGYLTKPIDVSEIIGLLKEI